MIKKIFKWTGLILLFLIAGVGITTAFRQHLTYSAPTPNIRASTDTAVIARGKHIVYHMAHCADCHGKGNVDSLEQAGAEIELSGGREFKLPFGSFYTRNITPDKESGIGNRSDADIARILRYGVRPDGEAVLPFMPFQNMSDEDLTAVISYLRSIKPVHHKVPDHDYNILGNVVKAFMIKPAGPTGPIPASVPQDSSANYGRYLVMNVANCNECHTKRDGIGNYVGEPMAGGSPFEEKGLPTLTPPNLTPDSSSRIFGWSQELFIKRFRMGKTIPYSHMPWNTFKGMTDMELKAIFNYLKTLKPVRTNNEQGTHLR
jgi:mono/diheme cytochrome c family protein